LINLCAVRTVYINRLDGQLCDRLFKFSLKFFPDLSRVQMVLPCRPNGRTLAARIFHIKASHVQTMNAII
jgi:hypothetical protein